MIQTTHICICIKPDPHACHCCVDEKRVALSQHISSSSASRHCKFILYISFKSCWFSIASIVNKNFCMSLSFCLRLRHCDFYDCSHVLLHGMLHGVTYLKCPSSFFLDVVQKWFWCLFFRWVFAHRFSCRVNYFSLQERWVGCVC